MLEVNGLRSGYGKTLVIDGISLKVDPGEMLAVLGRNGVGKTTLLRSIFGLCDVFDGSILLHGEVLKRARPALLARRGLSLMPDDRGVFPSLTVGENIRLARRKHYRPPVDVEVLFPLLRERANQPAGELSGGQMQQVGLARAMLAGEKLIAIDEFSQGLQPSLAHAALRALQDIAATGVAVLLVAQGPKLPLAYADRIVGILKGRIVFDEPTEILRNDSDQLTDLLVVS